MDKNLKAFLGMLPFSEMGTEMIAKSDRGYNVIVGSTPKKMDLFTSYRDHPRKLVELKNSKGVVTIRSTAAGRYQILARYFDAYKASLKLPDFSPESQDKIAIQMIREQKAYDDVIAGRFAVAVQKCANIWASLPGAGYGQHENKMADLQASFVSQGGVLA